MKKIKIILFALVLLTTLAYSDDSRRDDFSPQYYDNAKVLRVKYSEGEAYVKRSYDEGNEEASVNLPIFEKDIAGTTDGRIEIYLGRLNYLRLDYDTEVVFEKIPELQKTDMTLRILKGGVYLDIENLGFERDIEIQTADCGVFLLDKGVYRINVNESGRTEVYVFDGNAEVAGDNYDRNVRENQKIVMYDGRVKERPYNFYSSDYDDFDQWNQERNDSIGYARYSSSRYMENGYEEYEHELSRSGRWKYHPTYRSYIWIPYNIDIEWRPYYNGRWVWNPYYGYVWTSYDSWGYFTHHYGRWHWDPSYHWYWIPSYHWSPAWVSWFYDNDYYGWCPISWWNRPVIVINNYWWHDYHYWNGIPVHARSTIVIKKSQLVDPGIHRIALKNSHFSKSSMKSIVFKGNGPRNKPDISNVNVIDARGKTVIYKKNGIISSNKYSVFKNGSENNSSLDKKGVVFKYSSTKISEKKINKYSSDSENSGRDTLKSKTFKFKSTENNTENSTFKKRTLDENNFGRDTDNNTGNDGNKTKIREKGTDTRFTPKTNEDNTDTDSNDDGNKTKIKEKGSDKRFTPKTDEDNTDTDSDDDGNKTKIKEKGSDKRFTPKTDNDNTGISSDDDGNKTKIKEKGSDSRFTPKSDSTTKEPKTKVSEPHSTPAKTDSGAVKIKKKKGESDGDYSYSPGNYSDSDYSPGSGNPSSYPGSDNTKTKSYRPSAYRSRSGDDSYSGSGEKTYYSPKTRDNSSSYSSPYSSSPSYNSSSSSSERRATYKSNDSYSSGSSNRSSDSSGYRSKSYSSPSYGSSSSYSSGRSSSYSPSSSSTRSSGSSSSYSSGSSSSHSSGSSSGIKSSPSSSSFSSGRSSSSSSSSSSSGSSFRKKKD